MHPDGVRLLLPRQPRDVTECLSHHREQGPPEQDGRQQTLTKGQQRGSKVLALNGLGSTPEPFGLEFDLKGNLLVMDGLSVLIYAPPFKGYPRSMIPLNLGADYGKLDAANRNLYVSEEGEFGGAVFVYAYPSGTFEYAISNGQTSRTVHGIAVDPPSRD